MSFFRRRPPDDENDPDRAAARARIENQPLWVDLQIQRAVERGEFDDLPGAGKPIDGLSIDGTHDPDWWVKRLIEREQITGVLPPALQLRKDDGDLDRTLDSLANPAEVRRHLEEFNRRVIEARRQLQGGPPVITPLRDIDAEIEKWRSRRGR